MIWMTLAFAQSEYEPALRAELERAEALSLPGAPALYALRYRLAVLEQRDTVARFGSLLRTDDTPFHGLGVELRLGSPAYDNTGFGGWENGLVRGGLAREITNHDIRQVAWRLTDRAYKEAVEQLARKSAQFEPPDDHPGDWIEPGKVSVGGSFSELTDTEALRQRVVALSDVFTPAGDRLLLGEVVLGQEAGGVLLVDRAGTSLVRPMEEVSLRAYAHLRTKDGMLLTDSRLFTARQPAGLPSDAAMKAEVEALRDGLLKRADAVPLADEYVGPVLFEDAAAVDVFRYLLVPQLEGTPAEVPYDSWFGDLGETRDPVRVGRRVLPDGWTADDDPQADPAHPSAYAYDWEGAPAESVDLVEDGIVRDLLMSQVPRKGVKPNGHGRAFLGYRASGRVTQLAVNAPKSASSKKLRKRGLKMAAAYGHDFVIVIRRLQEDAIRAAARSMSVFGGEESGLYLPPPVEVVKLYSDGREEVVRGARFAAVERFVLRDIALSGPQRSATFLAPLDGDYANLSPTEGLPTFVSAPDILVREVELIPTGGDSRDEPVLDLPTP